MSKKYAMSKPAWIESPLLSETLNVGVSVKFTVFPGRRETLIDPEEPPSIEVDSISFVINGKSFPMPDEIAEAFSQDEGFAIELMQDASEQDEIARDDEADARRERMREE